MIALPLTLPDDLVPYAPRRARTLPLHGGTAELAWLPTRRERAGHDRERPPAFAPSPAARILEAESYWRSETLALTPNKFPFGVDQRILWMAQPAREPDLVFWEAALDWVQRSDGTALLNNIGAAATIPRAHAHLLDERLPLLEQLPERPLRAAPIDLPKGCSLVAKDLDACILGLRGPVGGCADALTRLADARLTPTWNVVLTRDAAWIVPRAVQTPAPHFETALGAAEFWGRFCYVNEAAYERATGADLTEAWRRAAARPVA